MSYDFKPSDAETIRSFNQPGTLVVISVYPRRGELYSTGKSGVASYTKNVIRHFRKKTIVLAEYDDRPEMYREGNTLVVRCFRNRSMSMYADLAKTLARFYRPHRIMVQYDFSLYGDTLTSGSMLLFMAFLKAIGKQVTAVLHHVVTDIRKLSGHVGLTDSAGDELKAMVYNTVFHLFYRMLDVASTRVVILEAALKPKLEKFMNPNKITCIPHGVDTGIRTLSPARAKKALGVPKDTYVVLFFGYVNWFKGADLFAKFYGNTSKILGKPVRFMIAGGESPTMKDHRYYRKYFAETEKLVSGSKAVFMTGYVPQKKLASYFAAADLVVLPYRHFMTASGVLSLVLSHKKPFIVSTELQELFDAPDFQAAFEREGFRQEDLTFSLDAPSCRYVTEKVLKNGLKEKIRRMAVSVSRQRAYANTAALYEEVAYAAPVRAPSFIPALRYTE